MSRYIILILGMTIVTYLPRMLPFFFVSNNISSPWLNRFLRFIPYAALGALIIPGSFSAIPEAPIFGVIGIAAAAICAWYRKGVIIPVFAAIAVSYIMLCFV